MSRVDWMRSIVRSAGEETWKLLFTGSWAKRIRRALTDLRDWTVRVDSAGVTAVLARAEGVRDVSADARRGALWVDATLEDGSPLSFALRVASVRFASGGAKEIVYELDPPSARDRSATISLVSLFSSLIARMLWGRLLGPSRWGGIVPSRDGERGLLVDLRQAERARSLIAQGPTAMVLEVLDLETVELERGTVAVKLRRPPSLKG